MIEIRLHGRGGQGAVTASEVLAIAAFKDGKFSQAFPSFGPERTGAPVESYCRIDDKFINIRTHIYEPDFLIVLDPSLLETVDITKGLKKNGTIIINSEKKPELGYKVYCANATKIAIETLGKAIVNTAMLGALIRVTNLVKLQSLFKEVSNQFGERIGEKNVRVIQRAHDEVQKSG